MNNNLLLLHGALGTKEQFIQLKEILSHHFTVNDLDFNGHGKSESTEDFSIDLFTNNAIEFLRKNKIEKTNIFGYSMGGYVALNMALKAPLIVDKIITLGTKFNWTEKIAEKEIRMLNPDMIEEKVPAFAQKLKTIHSPNDWKEVVNKTAKMMLELGAGKRLSTENLNHISNKTLITIGNQDRMVSIEESRESAENLPNGKLEIIEGFPHQIEKIDKHKLAQIIQNFLLN